MAGFRINYEKVIGQANEINDLSHDLGNEILKLQNVLNSVKANWKGPASTAYQSHLALLISDMSRTRNSMARSAAIIRNVATSIQKEDERQAVLAKLLTGTKK